MTTAASFSLIGLRRPCAPMVWLFVFLVLAVFFERRGADYDLNDDAGVVVQNEEAVEGEEILMMLLATNDVAIPIAPKIARLPGERPVLLVATALSLLRVRRLESRAPPAFSITA